MVNEELGKYIQDFHNIVLPVLNKYIFAMTTDEDMKLRKFEISEFTLRHIGTYDLIEDGVYADSHPYLVNSYCKRDLGKSIFGKTIFCGEAKSEKLNLLIPDNSDEGNENFVEMPDTQILYDTFEKLEMLRQKNIDRTVFCVLQDEKTSKFQVVAMQLCNLMISGSGYHYREILDNNERLRNTGCIVACDLNDDIGRFTAVFGERCFLSSAHAFKKTKELNESIKKNKS